MPMAPATMKKRCTIELACNFDADAVIPDPVACDFVSCLALAARTTTLATSILERTTTTELALMLHSLRLRRGMSERFRCRWRVR